MSLQGASSLVAELSSFNTLTNPTAGNTHGDLLNNVYIPTVESQSNSDSVGVGTGDSLDVLVNNGLHSQDSFGRWINHILNDDPGSIEDPVLGTSLSSSHDTFVSTTRSHLQSPVPEQIFSITDMSPEWGYSNEKTKVCFFIYGCLYIYYVCLNCI